MPHKPYNPATSGPQVHDRRAQNTGKDAGGKRVTRRLLLAAGFAVARLTIAVSAEPLTISGPARVIDGNTVAIGDVYVRLKGVDAAVLGTARGEHARRVMLEIVTSELTCRLTGENTYSREVGFCTTADGVDINRAIIEQGAALACPRYDLRYMPWEQPEALVAQIRSSYCVRR
jgi:endonuclease YncB( thermonuclease family)